MAGIQLLSREISELIAAGEVIERPSSVVKELVENAIDAGAASITVELKNGGVRYIRVTDDGEGIAREDVPKAFFRHATSKVGSIDDLYQIATLGFRGEALASIAAVSHMEVLTKTKEDVHGIRYEIAGGVPGVMEDAGCPVGTTMIVRDLFYNIPARMKFLKKDSTEGNAVAGLLDRIALSHPEISFRLIKEGERKLHTPGDAALLSAIHAVYGGEFGGSLIPVSYRQGGLAVEGFVTKPELCKPSRAMEHFFINGRYVKSVTMMAALEDAYKNTVMVGRFPGCVLGLTIPHGMVDVNVHPAKLEVKLSDEGVVYEAVLAGCRGAITGLGQAAQARDTGRAYQGRLNMMELLSRPDAGEQQRLTAQEYRQMAQTKPEATPRYKGDPSTAAAVMRDSGVMTDALYRQAPPRIMPPVYRPEESAPPKKMPLSAPADASLSVTNDRNDLPSMQGGGLSAPERVQTPQGEPRQEGEPIVLIGEVFHTYILAHNQTELLLIDKHAAHERILFEQLMAAHRQGQIPQQTLLVSLRVSLAKERYDVLLEHLEVINRAGFDIGDFGDGSVLVREIPAVLEIEQVESVVTELADRFFMGKGKAQLDIYDELYHSIACKGAVKGNCFTTVKEQAELLKMLENDPSIRHCPHGRPVMIAMTRRELDKMFGRTQ